MVKPFIIKRFFQKLFSNSFAAKSKALFGQSVLPTLFLLGWVSTAQAAVSCPAVNDPVISNLPDRMIFESADISITGNMLTAKMYLKQLPATIQLNAAPTLTNILEYRWGIAIDVDNNKSTGRMIGLGSSTDSGFEYEMYTMHFSSGHSPSTVPFGNGFQNDVWSAGRRVDSATLTTSLVDNSITLTGNIPSISSNSRFRLFAYDWSAGVVGGGTGSSFTLPCQFDATAVNPTTITASLTASTKTGAAPLTVGFGVSASSSNPDDILNYTWNFGDGQTGAGVNPQHTYQNAGNYSVKLTVDNGKGQSANATETVTVNSLSPIAQPTTLIASGSFAEPNDTPAEATPILINDQPLFQFFTSPSDEDWYEIYAKAGQNYTIDIPAASIGRLINPVLELYDAAGNLLVSQLSSTNQIHWTAPSSGLFRIRVTNQPLVASRSPATEAYQGEAVDYSYQIRVFLTDASQQALTKGRVLDSCEQGINGANVSALLGSVLADSTLTNKLGEFGLLLNAGNYDLKIAATNYQEASQTVTVGQQATVLAPIKLTATTTNSCVSNPATKAQQTPAFYDDRLGLLTIKNIVVDDRAVYYVELKNIGDYRFRLDKFLAIPGVILDNPPSYSSGTALATLPEVFALTRNWKVQLKHAGNGILTIHSASPH